MASESFVLPNARVERPIASGWHTVFVLVFAALNAWRGALHAVQARAGEGPTRPYMYLRTMFFELLFLGIVVVGVRMHGTSLRTIFGARWRSPGQVLRDLGLGVGLLLASIMLVSMLGGHGGAPPDQGIAFLLPHGTLEMILWVVLSLVAGICEEAVYRGYFQRQFAGILHNDPAGILISGVLFGAAHLYQGYQRASVIAVSAILFGVVAEWRGTVRPGMVAHTLQDAVAPLLIRMMRH